MTQQMRWKRWDESEEHKVTLQRSAACDGGQKLRLPASVNTRDDFFGGVQRVPVASRLNRLNITSNQLERD